MRKVVARLEVDGYVFYQDFEVENDMPVEEIEKEAVKIICSHIKCGWDYAEDFEKAKEDKS